MEENTTMIELTEENNEGTANGSGSGLALGIGLGALLATGVGFGVKKAVKAYKKFKANREQEASDVVSESDAEDVETEE